MLKITGTYNKPTIEFNSETGVLLIEGKSFTVNSIIFYKPLLRAIADYKNYILLCFSEVGRKVLWKGRSFCSCEAGLGQRAVGGFCS